MEPNFDNKKIDAEIGCLFKQIEATKENTYPSHNLKVVNAYIEQKVAEQPDPKKKEEVRAEMEKNRTALYVSYVRVHAQMKKDRKFAGPQCRAPASILVRPKPISSFSELMGAPLNWGKIPKIFEVRPSVKEAYRAWGDYWGFSLSFKIPPSTSPGKKPMRNETPKQIPGDKKVLPRSLEAQQKGGELLIRGDKKVLPQHFEVHQIVEEKLKELPPLKLRTRT